MRIGGIEDLIATWQSREQAAGDQLGFQQSSYGYPPNPHNPPILFLQLQLPLSLGILPPGTASPHTTADPEEVTQV